MNSTASVAVEGETAEVSFDHDYLVIGSGFGGSVSALRLTQKGWRVGVGATLCCGQKNVKGSH